MTDQSPERNTGPTNDVPQPHDPSVQEVHPDAPAGSPAETPTPRAGDSDPVADDAQRKTSQQPPGVAATRSLRAGDDISDAESIPADDTSADSDADHWDADNEVSARRVAVELRRIELEVRELLEGRDGRRKRKLAGTRRWLELEDDIRQWRFSSRMDEVTNRRLLQLIQRRHFLLGRLRFLASTRPTWNT